MKVISSSKLKIYDDIFYLSRVILQLAATIGISENRKQIHLHLVDKIFDEAKYISEFFFLKRSLI